MTSCLFEAQMKVHLTSKPTIAGDIHLNDRMTWTDRVISDDEIRVNDFIRPNLYSIVLHEFGHSLGLRYLRCSILTLLYCNLDLKVIFPALAITNDSFEIESEKTLDSASPLKTK